MHFEWDWGFLIFLIGLKLGLMFDNVAIPSGTDRVSHFFFLWLQINNLVWKVDLVRYVNCTSSLISFLKNLGNIYIKINMFICLIYWIRGEWKKRLDSQLLGVNSVTLLKIDLNSF